jgi:hypothetical protein
MHRCINRRIDPSIDTSSFINHRWISWSALEGLSLSCQPAFEPLGTVTVATRPRFFSARIAASAACMGVLDLQELEIVFPVGPLFRQRRGAEAHLDPFDSAVRQLSGVRHVAQVLIARDGAVTERALVNGALQRLATAGSHTGCDEISHVLRAARLQCREPRSAAFEHDVQIPAEPLRAI